MIQHGLHGRGSAANAQGLEGLPGELTSQRPSHHGVTGTVLLPNVYDILLLDGGSAPGLRGLAPGVDKMAFRKLLLQHVEDVHLFVAPAHLPCLCHLHRLRRTQLPGREGHLQALAVLDSLLNLLEPLARPAFPFILFSTTGIWLELIIT